MAAPKVGDTIERFTLESVLGEGGMGTVFRAHDARLDRRLAIKVLRCAADAPGHAEATARLVREAKAAAAFDHPNVVSIFDVGEVDGAPYIAMELVPGRTLREVVGDASVPLAERLRWLGDVAKALSAAHRAGLVHRDVKPENVMVRDDGVVKVLDFGIARRSATAADPSAPTQASAIQTLTAQGIPVGTPLYMAPEQIRSDAVDGRTDQFQFGVLAYELLSGRVPWAVGGDALALAASILTDEPVPLLERVPAVPPPVAAAVMRMLSKRPADRFASMDDAARALEAEAGNGASAASGGASRVPVSVPAPAARAQAAPSQLASAFLSRRFSEEELRTILERALRKQQEAPPDRGFRRDEMIEAAREVGIDRTTLEAAIRDVDATTAGRVAPSALERSRRQVKLDLAKFAVVNAFLAMMALYTRDGGWFIWVFFGWGMVVALKAVRVLVLNEPLEPKRKKKDAKAFERNVDDGVELLFETTRARVAPRLRIGAPGELDAEREALAVGELDAEPAPRRALHRAD